MLLLAQQRRLEELHLALRMSGVLDLTCDHCGRDVAHDRLRRRNHGLRRRSRRRGVASGRGNQQLSLRHHVEDGPHLVHRKKHRLRWRADWPHHRGLRRHWRGGRHHRRGNSRSRVCTGSDCNHRPPCRRKRSSSSVGGQGCASSGRGRGTSTSTTGNGRLRPIVRYNAERLQHFWQLEPFFLRRPLHFAQWVRRRLGLGARLLALLGRRRRGLVRIVLVQLRARAGGIHVTGADAGAENRVREVAFRRC